MTETRGLTRIGGQNVIDVGDGDNCVVTGCGRESVLTDSGNVCTHARAGNDSIHGDYGDEVIVDGDDYLNGGYGQLMRTRSILRELDRVPNPQVVELWISAI